MSSRVQWAKVAHDAVYLLFKGVMPETRFDFGLSQRCRRDAHRLLPTPQKRLRTSSLSILSLDPREKEKRDKACSALLSGVSVENVLGTVSILVLAACDEVGPVRGKLQVRDDVHVNALGGLNRNHHHGRFFPQKGTPLAAVLRPSPHGQLEGTPLTDS